MGLSEVICHCVLRRSFIADVRAFILNCRARCRLPLYQQPLPLLLWLPARLDGRLKRACRHSRARCISSRRAEAVAREHHIPRMPALPPRDTGHRGRELSARLHQLPLLPLLLRLVLVELHPDKERRALPATARTPIHGVEAAWQRTQRQLRDSLKLPQQACNRCLRQT